MLATIQKNFKYWVQEFWYFVFLVSTLKDLVRLEYVKDYGRFLVVFIRDGKIHRSRSFTIIREGCPFVPCILYNKYIDLRPEYKDSRILLIACYNGKFSVQYAGCYTISDKMRLIAEYLNWKRINGIRFKKIFRKSKEIGIYWV